LKNKITIVICTTLILSGTIFIPNIFAENIPIWVENTDSKSPELIAEMWVNGLINDDEFLRSVNDLIEKEIITIQSDSITNTSDLPDWLVNNAGWWAARIFTNSDFVFDPGYLKEEIYPCSKESGTKRDCLEETYNSYGLRTPEFEKEKPDNTFRIFTLGGSTTWGAGTSDDETWPAHLQKIINEKITDKEVEVINAGTPGGTTKSEYGSIKNKLLFFDPDLIIMYDGWNDIPHPTDETFENWKSVCKLGKNEGFDTIIIVQATTHTGHRVLTEQEAPWIFSYIEYLQKSQEYVDTFEELDKVCTKTADFRKIFDYVQEPIFFDTGHTMSFGNKIIAENVFSVISPIYFGQTYSVIHSNLNSENNEPGTGVVYAAGADLSGKNFDNLNLQSAIFDKANLSNTNFKNADVDRARFAFANLTGADLSGKDLTGTILIGADLSDTNLTGTILKGADLSHTNLTGADLSGKDLTGTILKGADLSHTNLSGADLSGKDLTGTILTGVDLSGKDLTGAILIGADLSDTNLTGTILKGADLTDAIITGAVLTGVDLENAVLTYTILNCEGDLKDKTGIQVLQCYIAMLTQSCKFWIFHLCN